jgi:hypothetical protein
MKMGLIQINQPDFSPTHLFKQRLKLADKLGSLLWIAFAQNFLALFPT